MSKEQIKLTQNALIDLSTVCVLVLVGMYIQSMRSDLNASAKEMDKFWITLTNMDERLHHIEAGACIGSSH